MLYSEQHKFLYIHVGKTGGSNMERALKQFSHQPVLTWLDRGLSRLGWHWNFQRYQFRQHDGANRATRVLPAAVFADCFKFAFVRNPWDWLASLYFFLKRKESHRHYQRVAQMSFPQYVDFEIRRNARHQHRFITDRRGRILVDYLGRFEELDSAFQYVCAKLNIECRPLDRISVFKHPPYQELYDECLKEKVRRHW